MTTLLELYGPGLDGVGHIGLVKYLCKKFGIAGEATDAYLNEHRLRRQAMGQRLRLYRDKAKQDVERLIDMIYETEEYRLMLKRYVPVALEENVTARIVDEVASLYNEPCLRTLKTRNEEFHAEEKRLELHEHMKEAHRLTALCNEVLVWQFRGTDGKNKLKLVTPDMFDAIEDPRDSLQPAGFVLDMCPVSATVGDRRTRLPHYEIWDDTYRYLVNRNGDLVTPDGELADKPLEHGLGRIPAVLFHRKLPMVTILDGDTGADIESCHGGVAMLNVMVMRLAKAQGENLPILKGNLAAMAMGQIAHGERPLMLPPEVTAEMLQMKTDPDHYLRVKKDKVSSTIVRYGISYEQYTNSEQGDSGKLFELRRNKLKEIRGAARLRAVTHEHQVVVLVGFDPVGMRLDYQEQALPQDATEKFQLMKDKASMGLDSPVKYKMREDPDLTRDEAIKQIAENQDELALVIERQRKLNMPADATLENPGKSPEENGADGGRPAPAPKDQTQLFGVARVQADAANVN